MLTINQNLLALGKSYLWDGVTQREEHTTELEWLEAASFILIEMLERVLVLLHLLVTDVVGVTCKDLVLKLVEVLAEALTQRVVVPTQHFHCQDSVDILENEFVLSLDKGNRQT